MALSPLVVLLSAFWIIVLLGGGFLVYYFMTWNIPVIILRYQGDKRRPQIKLSKAKRFEYGGIVRLYVRGYKFAIRDFKSEHYYPSSKGKNGALIVWEVKPGLLTPVIPKKQKGVSKKEHETILAEFQRYYEALTGTAIKGVDWQHDQDLYDQILLKAIDDTDLDFFLQERGRVDSQYVTGWRDFLGKYGGHVIIALIAICALVGFIVYIDKVPSLAGQCLQAGEEQARNVLKEFSGQLATGGPPV